MQGRWTIGKKLFTGVGVLIALLMASGATTLWTTRAMNERLVHTGEKTVRRIRLAERAQAEPLRMYIAEQMMLLARAAGDKALHETWKAKFDAAQAALQTELTQLDGLLEAGTSKDALAKFKQGSAAVLKAHEDVMALVAVDKHFEANQMSLDKVRPAMEANEAFIRIVVDNQTKLLDEDVAQSAVAYNRANLTGLLLLGIGVSVAGLVGWVVHSVNGRLRSTAADLKQGAEKVVSAASQVATSSQSLSQGATEQAASLEETSASMEEMASMTRKTSENAHQAATLVTGVAQQVEESNAALAGMVTSMSAIRESSNKVAKIIKTIDEIAFQTNILALNAAVEAARAGEQGRGFAVVASEVRSLAQRCGSAAREIKQLIGDSLEKVDAGSRLAESAGTNMEDIVASVVRVSTLIGQISQAAQEQNLGVQQINQAIAHIDHNTQQNAALVEEASAAAHSLQDQAGQLLEIVSGFQA